MITVSDKAKKRIEELIIEQNYTPSHFLRVGVESGGCSGLSYKLDFDNELKPGDEKFGDKGVEIVTDKRSVLYLNGKGFTFVNPNASRTCSCGESFSV